MILTFEGTVKIISDTQTGTNKSNIKWTKRDLVLTNASPSEKPTILSFIFWNDRVKQLDTIKPSDLVEVEYHIHAEEWNGKWINNVSARSIRIIQQCKEVRDAALVKNLQKTITIGKKLMHDNKDEATGLEILGVVKAISKDIEIPEVEKKKLLKMILDKD